MEVEKTTGGREKTKDPEEQWNQKNRIRQLGK
jgi:hypothetical protein